jgi:hypothetical protein
MQQIVRINLNAAAMPHHIQRLIIAPVLVAVFALSQVAFYFAFKYIIGSLDPLKAKRQEAKSKSAKSLAKLGV